MLGSIVRLVKIEIKWTISLKRCKKSIYESKDGLNLRNFLKIDK